MCPLLTQNWDDGVEEIELWEDDPATMFGLLRYIYDLPYISSSVFDNGKR